MKTAAIIGAGALGMLFGEKLIDHYGKENISFPMDDAHYSKHKHDRYTVNGRTMDARITSIKEACPVDLLIIATKYNGLDAAIRMADGFMDEHTVIISLLNGIISEQILSSSLGAEHVLGCVALGMDATRDGTTLHYSSPGKLQLGTLTAGQERLLQETAAYLQDAGIVV